MSDKNMPWCIECGAMSKDECLHVQIRRLKSKLNEARKECASESFVSIDQRDAEQWAMKKINEEALKNPEAMDEIQTNQIEAANGFVFSLWKSNRPVLTATGLRTAFNSTCVVLCRHEWESITPPNK